MQIIKKPDFENAFLESSEIVSKALEENSKTDIKNSMAFNVSKNSAEISINNMQAVKEEFGSVKNEAHPFIEQSLFESSQKVMKSFGEQLR